MASPVKIASAWRFRCSVFRFQCFCFSSLTPDTRHLKPQDLVPEIRRLKMFHYSTRLPHEGKTLKAPSGGGSKPDPQGSDSLLDGRLTQCP